MTLFDVMPTWIAYILLGFFTLIPLAICIGIIILITLGVKALRKYLKK